MFHSLLLSLALLIIQNETLSAPHLLPFFWRKINRKRSVNCIESWPDVAPQRLQHVQTLEGAWSGPAGAVRCLLRDAGMQWPSLDTFAAGDSLSDCGVIVLSDIKTNPGQESYVA